MVQNSATKQHERADKQPLGLGLQKFKTASLLSGALLNVILDGPNVFK